MRAYESVLDTRAVTVAACTSPSWLNRACKAMDDKGMCVHVNGTQGIAALSALREKVQLQTLAPLSAKR